MNNLVNSSRYRSWFTVSTCQSQNPLNNVFSIERIDLKEYDLDSDASFEYLWIVGNLLLLFKKVLSVYIYFLCLEQRQVFV